MTQQNAAAPEQPMTRQHATVSATGEIDAAAPRKAQETMSRQPAAGDANMLHANTAADSESLLQDQASGPAEDLAGLSSQLDQMGKQMLMMQQNMNKLMT